MFLSHLTIGILPILVSVLINVRSAPPMNTVIGHRLSPDEYRSVSYPVDEISTDFHHDVDDDDDVDEPRESLCEQAMSMIIHHADISKLNPSIVLNYCPQYKQSLAWIQEHHNRTSKEDLQEGFKRIQSHSPILFDYNKRQALRRRELNKRVALRFIRKQMS